MATLGGPNLITSGLTLYLDAGNSKGISFDSSIYNNVYSTSVIKSELDTSVTHPNYPVYKVTSLDNRLDYSGIRIMLNGFVDSYKVCGYYRRGNNDLTLKFDRSDRQAKTFLVNSNDWTYFDFTYPTEMNYSPNSWGPFIDFTIYGNNTSGYTVYVAGMEIKRYKSVLDLIGNNNGELWSGVSYGYSNMGSLVFDGVDDAVVIGYKSEFNTIFNSGFTMSMWMNLYSGSTTRYIFNRGEFPFSVIVSNTYYFYLRDVGGVNYIGRMFSKSLIEDKGISMFTITWDGTYSGTGFKFYLNAVEIATTNYSFGVVTEIKAYSNNFMILEDISGNLYNASIYNRSLSSREILQNYNATKSRFI